MLAKILRRSPALPVLIAVAAGAFALSRGNEPASSGSGGVAVAASFNPAALEPVALPAHTEVFLRRAGFTPEVIAAAGSTADHFNAFMSHSATACPIAQASLGTCDSAYVTARQNCDALQREVRTGLADQETVTALATAKAAVATQEAARDAVIASFQASGCEELPESGETALQNILANRDWKLPTEFLVVQRSEADWIRLRDALVEEKAAARFGVDPNPELASFLATARADEAVAAAKTNLDANLSAIQAAWTASFTE